VVLPAIIRINNLIWITLLVTIWISGCNLFKNSVEEEVIRPSWVQSRPSDASYYIGIGVTSKKTNPFDYSMIAQRNALNEIAAQIEAKVSSNSMLFSFEKDTEFTDEYKEFIQVQSSQQLANYEQVDVWEYQEEYWVYYRLSKTQYRADRQKKIDAAVDRAKILIEQGNKNRNERKYQQALQSYFNATEVLKPFLGESIQAEMEGEQVFLGNYLMKQFQDINSDIELRPKSREIETYWGLGTERSQLEFFLGTKEGNALVDFPLRFAYSEGRIKPRTGITDVNGMTSTEIPKMISTVEKQVVMAKVDYEELWRMKHDQDALLQSVLSKLEVPNARIQLNVNAPKVYINIQNKQHNSALKPVIISGLKKKGLGVTATKSSAQLLFTLKSEMSEGAQNYGMSQIDFTGRLELSDLSGKVIYQEDLSGIKGVKDNYSNARKDAIDRAARHLEMKSIPRLYRSLIK
jgi:hypothetical protein